MAGWQVEKMRCRRPRGFQLALLSSLALGTCRLAVAQVGGGEDKAALGANMQKFQEMFSLATKLMSFGGDILNNAQPGSKTSRDGVASNGILAELRPPSQARATQQFGASDEMSRLAMPTAGGSGASDYGGGPLGLGTRPPSRSILDTLMGSFLGSSLNAPQPTSRASVSSIFQPSNYEGYGGTQSPFGGSSQGSNIDAIVNVLSQNGAKRAQPDENASLSPASLLSQFFGGG